MGSSYRIASSLDRGRNHNTPCYVQDDVDDYEIALMHANGQPAPDSDRARQLYPQLDDVVVLLGTHPSGLCPDGPGPAAERAAARKKK